MRRKLAIAALIALPLAGAGAAAEDGDAAAQDGGAAAQHGDAAAQDAGAAAEDRDAAAQDGGAAAQDGAALAECLTAHAGEEEVEAFRDFLIFALTDEPADVLDQGAAAFQESMIALATADCGATADDFGTEAGRQAADAYTDRIADRVIESAFDRLNR